MAQRDHLVSCSLPIAGATRRCPVKPNTPLGPDQVNVLLVSFILANGTGFPDHGQYHEPGEELAPLFEPSQMDRSSRRLATGGRFRENGVRV
jgi:hypothetical protein